MKVSDKDIRFVIWAAVTSLVLMGLLHLSVPRAPSDETYSMEEAPVADLTVKSTYDKLEILDPSAVRQLIKTKDNTPTFVLVYTSWCPHCRQTLPDMLSLKEKGFFKHARIIFISIDENPQKLAKYLSQPSLQAAFTPYIIDPKQAREGISVFSEYGFKFSGAIPYAVLLDANGKVVMDTSKGWDDMLSAIKSLQ